jgi:hypothetical protein
VDQPGRGEDEVARPEQVLLVADEEGDLALEHPEGVGMVVVDVGPRLPAAGLVIGFA